MLDLALFFDLASRAGMSGIQKWLSFYFKSPMTAPGLYPEHDLFAEAVVIHLASRAQDTVADKILRFALGAIVGALSGWIYVDRVSTIGLIEMGTGIAAVLLGSAFIAGLMKSG